MDDTKDTVKYVDSVARRIDPSLLNVPSPLFMDVVYETFDKSLDRRPAPPAFEGEWYSICSRHLSYDPTCGTCNAGKWVSTAEHEMSNWLWNYSKRIWRKWANRKGDKFLEKVFPKLTKTHPSEAEEINKVRGELEALQQKYQEQQLDLAVIREAADFIDSHRFVSDGHQKKSKEIVKKLYDLIKRK